MKYLLIKLLFVVAILSSCNPLVTKELRKKVRQEKKVKRFKAKIERQYARFEKKNPDLVVNDTIIDSTEFTIEAIDTTTVIETNTDVSGIDDVLVQFDTIRTILTDTQYVLLTRYLKKYVTERRIINDTVRIEIDSVTTVYLYYNDSGELIHRITRPEKTFVKKTKRVVKTIKPPDFNLYERSLLFIQGFWHWIIGILIAIIVLAIIRKTLKNFFPFIP